MPPPVRRTPHHRTATTHDATHTTHTRTSTRHTRETTATTTSKAHGTSDAKSHGATTSTNEAKARATVTGGTVRSDGAAAKGGTALGDGVRLTKGKLLVDGVDVVARTQIEHAGAAELLSAAVRVTGGDAIGKLSASGRKSLVDELAPVLSSVSVGRASLHDVRARSGAFALLENVLVAMRAKGEAPDAAKLLRALVDAAKREKNPGLRAHMQRRVAGLPPRVLALGGSKSDDVREAIAGMKSAHAHARPNREQWLKGNPPKLDILASVMDEFWGEELAEYKNRGYEVKESGKGLAHAVKVFNDVKPPVTVEVELRQRDDGVLDGLGESKFDIVLYTGHAQLGGVGKISVDNGPSSEHGQKLVAFFACRSKQNADALERRYPDEHLLLTREGTYAHDDRIVLHTLISGIVHNESYDEIEKGAKGLWEKHNYFLPQESAKIVDTAKVYVPASKADAGTALTMEPSAHPKRAADLPRGPVDDAVGWLNTIQGYWAEENPHTAVDKALHDNITSGGFFDGTAKDPPVRVRDVGDKIEVSANSAYGDQDPDAIAMMVSFLGGQAVAARGDPKRTDEQKRMFALSIVAEYTYFLVEYSDTADTLLGAFAKKFNFPPGLTWPVAQKAVDADMENDCSQKMQDALAHGMQFPFLEVNPARTTPEFRKYIGGALAELAKSDSKLAKLTHEMITTGKVRVDTLDDLTKPDYERVRRDMLKEGTHLGARANLHDHEGKAFRAIKSDMDGYMWDDRIYVSPGLSDKMLAATLVHEVNHVLNKSEEHYQGDKAVLREEYRAFFAENTFLHGKLSKDQMKALKERVIRDYDLKNVTVDDVADVPPGIIDAA